MAESNDLNVELEARIKASQASVNDQVASLSLATQKLIFRSFLGLTDRIKIYKQMAVLFNNNIPKQQVIAEMYVVLSRRDQPIDKNRDFEVQLKELLDERPRQAGALLMQDILRGMKRGGSSGKGRSMAESMAGWVTDQELSLIRSGEATGTMAKAMQKCVFMLKKRSSMTQRIMFSLAQPVLVIVGIFVAFFANGYYLAPALLKLAPISRWTGDTRSLLEWGIWTRQWALLIVLAVGSVFGWVAWSLPRLTGKWRDRLERIPPWSIYRMFQGSIFLLNLSTLLASGIAVEEALNTIMLKTTPYLRERLLHALRGLAKGLNIGEALHAAEHGFPDPDTIGFLRVLAGRAGFAKALDDSIEEWLDQSIDTIVRQANFVRLILMFVGGYVLTWMFGAVYGMSDIANHP